ALRVVRDVRDALEAGAGGGDAFGDDRGPAAEILPALEHDDAMSVIRGRDRGHEPRHAAADDDEPRGLLALDPRHRGPLSRGLPTKSRKRHTMVRRLQRAATEWKIPRCAGCPTSCGGSSRSRRPSGSSPTSWSTSTTRTSGEP